MDHCSMDPYEQQLLSVFDSYDVDHRGSLDQDGLNQLCNTLQLEEQGAELIKCLLSDSKLHVTFNEFKDGLLALLGSIQQQNNQQKTDNHFSSESESESPDRELSPKFVYGSKKYGRRSRPEDNLSPEVFAEKPENKTLKNVHKVQRSNSQSDVTHSKKRKTNIKLKRCTSFPGNHDNAKPFTNWSVENETKYCNSSVEYNEDILRGALDGLGVGKDGYLSQFELVQVCESIGLHKLTEKLLNQLTIKHKLSYNKQISVDEFVDALQKDDGLYEITSPTHSLESTLNNSCITEDSLLYPNSKAIQYISLGPDGSGYISSQMLVDMWENSGIQSPSNLLQELGFTETQISITELASILEDELRTLNDNRTNISYPNISPHIVLLQATISLYQSEVKYLKILLEQLNAERDKLRCDIADANYRASLLAQEVDDNHAKMEKSTQKQVKLLEQKHSDLLKDLTEQFASEKEQISNLNSKLEKRVSILENEETKLKSDLIALKKYNGSLEKENNTLNGKIAEMEQIRNALSERVVMLENECRKISELEREHDQIEPLLQKISVLQLENSELRDKNDELCSEVENLNSKIVAMRIKMSSTPTFNLSLSSANGEENVSTICEGVELGAIKRRVDSPSKENYYNMESESPRLGKVRRCYNKNQSGEILLDVLGNQMALNSSESGYEVEFDYLDSSTSFTESNDEMSRLQARVTHLEQLLQQHSIKVPDNYLKNDKLAESEKHIEKDHLVKRCKKLESIIEEIQMKVSNISCDNISCNEKCKLKEPISLLCDKLQNVINERDSSTTDISLNSSTVTVLSANENLSTVDSAVGTELSDFDMEMCLKEKLQENAELLTRCDDLQQALEMLRNEYDSCENYWSVKLDEERQMFEQEQKQSSDKLNELLIKISEYEDQFEADGRLPTIDENDFLEKTYLDLEREFEDFKHNTETEFEIKNGKIIQLQEKLNQYQMKRLTLDASLQVSLQDFCKINQNLSNVIESSNIFSSETFPHLWKTPQSSNSLINSDSVDSSLVIINNIVQERDYTNPAFVWNNENKINSEDHGSALAHETSGSMCNSLPASIWKEPSTVSSPQPHSLTIIPDNNSSHQNQKTASLYRVKRSRKHERNIFTTSQIRSQRKEQDLPAAYTSETNYQTKWNGPDFHNVDQTCIVSLRSIHHLHRRLHELDQHCRHLQFILKQQQQHSERVMHHCWKQYRDEVNDMQLHLKSVQEKLARSDMLIKDLYIENTHLIANNQRLEHRCHMLIQCNTESTSV